MPFSTPGLHPDQPLEGRRPGSTLIDMKDEAAQRPTGIGGKFRGALQIGIIWLGFLAVLSALALDMGESKWAYDISLGGWLAFVVFLWFRRPHAPSRIDLLFVAWGFPVLFFLLFLSLMVLAG